jgi:uncharacterized protein DUF5681
VVRPCAVALRNSTDLFFLWLRADWRIKNAIIGLQSSNTVSAHMPSNLWQPGQSGNPVGRVRGSRNKLSEEVICALLRDFREHGQKAIAKVRRTQPAAYLKVLALLVPREHKVEYSNSLKNWTDEELEAGIDLVKQMLESRAAASGAVIEGTAKPVSMLAHAELEQPQRKPNRR